MVGDVFGREVQVGDKVNVTFIVGKVEKGDSESGELTLETVRNSSVTKDKTILKLNSRQVELR